LTTSETKKDSPKTVYWEDLVDAPLRRYGPLVFSSELLDQLLDLMGEKHPIHNSDAFAQKTSRRQRIIPGGFIHSITSGWVVKHSSATVSVVGLRSVTWDFIRPLYPDKPFFFTNRTTRASEVNERLGLIDTERRVFDEAEQIHAVGRMNVVVLRRPTSMPDADRDHANPLPGLDNRGALRGI